jgi:hypothetical protein
MSEDVVVPEDIGVAEDVVGGATEATAVVKPPPNTAETARAARLAPTATCRRTDPGACL